MSKFKRNSKLDYLKYGGLFLLLMITLGYALLSSNLNIIGTSNFARTTWNIHFENLVPSTNMTLAQGEGASITQNKTTEVTYTLNFTEPGQYYEFLVDAKNDGTIDGMVNTVTSTKKLGNETAVPITTSPSNLPAYLEYSATYSDGTLIAQYHLLESGEKETYKVRVAFSTDIDATDLPDSNQSIELTFGVEYVQKDDNAVPSHPDTGVYTANISDGTDESSVWIGQAIPNGITTYQTPALAMAALKQATGGETDRPFYLKHTLTNNVVTDSYVGFVISDDMVTNARNTYITNCNSDQTCIDSYQGMTAGTYYLKGKKTYEYVNSSWQCKSEYDDGNGYCLDPEYNANKQVLLSAFGNSNCTDNSSAFDCGAAGLAADATSDGYVNAHDDSWHCIVNGDGDSECSD